MSLIEKFAFEAMGQKITVVFMDREAFDVFCDKIKDLTFKDGNTGNYLPAGEGAKRTREDGHLDGLTRGLNTEFIFKMYSVQTRLMTVTTMKPSMEQELAMMKLERQAKAPNLN